MMNRLYERPPVLLFLPHDLFCERRDGRRWEEGFAEDIFLILAGNELAVYGFTSRSALLTQLDWSVLPLPPPAWSRNWIG